MAPFADNENPFAASRHYGYRFLVVRTAADSCTGRIVELIAQQPTTSDKAAYSALAGTKPFLTGLALGPVADFTGALLVYSPQYAYEAGLAYTAGALQPLRLSVYTDLPGLPPPDTCYDYFLVGYDNTGAQVMHDLLGLNCTGGIPGLGTSWDGGGGSATTGGGGGGGANGTLSPNTEKSRPLRVEDAPVQETLRVLSGRHGGWGFWKLPHRLRKNGRRINHKRSLRIYRAMGRHWPRRRTASGCPRASSSRWRCPRRPTSVGRWTLRVRC